MPQVPLSPPADERGRRQWVQRPFPLFVRTLAGAMLGRLALALVLTVLGALTEGMGLLALIPLLPTSRLDSENERRVQEAIERLHGHLTILVITHRLTTIRLADSIHVLEGGRLVESGDWGALLQGSAGRFRSLCEAQGLVV